MSSGCGDTLSLTDLQTAKKHQLFEAEVITGLQGGVAGGAAIDYATNQVTGQTQKTMPAILRDAGFQPASFDFTSGGTLTINDRNKVVYDPVSQAWYSWSGALPKVVAAGSNPLLDANWKPQTDPKLRADLANTADASKGDALIGVKQPFTGAATRTQHFKNTDYISVADFAGADPTGATASTAAFQAALDACSDKNNVFGYGRALHIPAGKWKIDAPLYYNWRNTNTQTDGDTRRLVIFGDGSACTFINDTRTTPGTTPLITFDGGQTDPFLRLSIRDLRFQRPSYDKLGWGLYFKNVAIMDIRNVDSQWFLNGAVCHDVLYAKFDHCQFGANDMGIRMSRLNWTRPNVFMFHQCMFGGNASGCVDITDGANIKFDTCNFEGTGTSNAGSQRTIQYTGGPEEGGIGLIVTNCYFENNFVFADIAIESNNATAFGGHIVEGNTFQRTSPTRYCKGHVNFSPNNSGGFQRLHFRGNTFKFLGGYAHNSGDFSITAQTDWAEVREEGNIYNSAQLPVYTGKVIDGYDNRVVATAKISPATPSISAGHNVASVTRVSTGVYRINFKKALSNVTVIPVATVEGGIGACSITGYDNTYVQVTTNSSAWTVSDSIAFNVVCIGIRL